MTFSGFTVKIKLRCACLLRLRAALSKSSHHKAHGGMTASAASHVDPQNHPKKEGWSLKKQYTSMRQTCSLWCTLRGAMPTCPAGQVSSKLPQCPASAASQRPPRPSSGQQGSQQRTQNHPKKEGWSLNQETTPLNETNKYFRYGALCVVLCPGAQHSKLPQIT